MRTTQTSRRRRFGLPADDACWSSAASRAHARRRPSRAPVIPPARARRPSRMPKPSFEIYGFAMLDIGHDFKQINPNWSDTMRVTKLPSFEDQFGEDHNTFAGVRQSRLGVRIVHADRARRSEDARSSSSCSAPAWTKARRRSGCATPTASSGAFGAGQTWSPFMDPDVFPNSLEYWGPTGMVFFRNVQVRWMPIKGEHSADARARAAGRERRPGRLRGPRRAARTSGRASRCPTSRAPTSTRRTGATCAPPACSG